MNDPWGLTRRRVLSGMATVGSIGAISGVGAVSLFAEEEVFIGNLLSVGELDLELCWGESGEACTPTDGPVTIDFGRLEKGDAGTATIQCSLEDNPAWTWLRTNCPDRPCSLQDAVTISLWYDMDCNGEIGENEAYVTVELSDAEQDVVSERVSSDIDLTTGIEIKDLPLCDALTILRTGTLLDHDPGTDAVDPFNPDSWCCLGFEWEVVDYICLEDSFELTFEFFTQQWRHNPEPTNPWPEMSDCTVDCTEECEDCAPKQGISFVAFCVEDGQIEDGDISLLPFYDVEDEVYKVKWESATPLDWVILYNGSADGKYFENFFVDGDTAGEVHINSQTHTPNDDDFHSKLEWEGNLDYTDLGQCPSDPCPDLTDELFGCGVRYNFESDGDRVAGEWDSVCGNSCPGEDGGGS